ncbi:hypothetical protein SK803_11250 [Lentzea sp. BCCO 10_0856]|uniref:Mce-associated membrane protein n=1 Tax=Lentzea miocenica TaxID=3095431 RepID=A0ABU4SYD9_9PSEU|nr:hypothetical protein [Lentzea sp. BCCO 10_0856]MDX8030792.1 hypothetical protein [Lentzea sp. BCCO 10_0856]
MRWAVVLLVPALALGASAGPIVLAGPDQRQIAGIAQRYLENRARKVTTGPQTPGFGVPVTPALAAKLDVHEAKLDAARRSPARTRYRSAEIKTRVDRFDVDQNRRVVVARVHEHAELNFTDAGTTQYTGYGLPHLLTFNRTNEGWVLADVALGHYKHCALLPETQQPSEC